MVSTKQQRECGLEMGTRLGFGRQKGWRHLATGMGGVWMGGITFFHLSSCEEQNESVTPLRESVPVKGGL